MTGASKTVWTRRQAARQARAATSPLTAVARTPNVRVMNAGAAWRLKIASVANLIAHSRANPE